MVPSVRAAVHRVCILDRQQTALARTGFERLVGGIPPSLAGMLVATGPIAVGVATLFGVFCRTDASASGRRTPERCRSHNLRLLLRDRLWFR
ncbi:MAG: hypothetical protein ACI9MC_002740 [Kiritimatiellia bacterium]|jgi:hypothetical protein